MSARPPDARAARGFPPLLAALGIGSAGGALFAAMHLPLAWMIGAMTFTTVAAIAGVPMRVPRRLRGGMIMVLGVMLGSGFEPEIVDRIGGWSVSLSGLAVYLAIATLVGVLYLRRVARLDRVTSYFTATPGGLNEMVLAGTQMGGDDRVISLVHAIRVMLVVITIPFAFQALGVYQPGSRGPLGPPLTAVAWPDMLLLGACVAGYPVAKLLRIPAAQLVGPMVLSAVIHLLGITEGKPPGVLVAAAQVVIGAALGTRFAGLSWSLLGRNAWMALGLTVIMLAITVAAAVLLDRATGLGVAALILAFAPGGLAEMSLIALALHTDVALVATHHIVRIVLIVTLAPAVFLLWRRLADGRGSAPGD